MTPEELRERVARDLFNTEIPDVEAWGETMPFDKQPKSVRNRYYAKADAAINVVLDAAAEVLKDFASEYVDDAWMRDERMLSMLAERTLSLKTKKD